LKSLQQAVTGKKIPFARTPKVSNRTATPLLFAFSPLLIIGYSVITVIRDYHHQNWGNAAFAGLNAIAASYAVIAFMGVRNALVDIWLGFVERLYVTEKTEPTQVVRRRRVQVSAVAEPSWQDVLYRGEPATETGTHFDGGGSFKILAAPPTAPPKHNRRQTDRRPVDRDLGTDRRDRRASDRTDSEHQH
jgi:hypothetical protein